MTNVTDLHTFHTFVHDIQKSLSLTKSSQEAADVITEPLGLMMDRVGRLSAETPLSAELFKEHDDALQRFGQRVLSSHVACFEVQQPDTDWISSVQRLVDITERWMEDPRSAINGTVSRILAESETTDPNAMRTLLFANVTLNFLHAVHRALAICTAEIHPREDLLPEGGFHKTHDIPTFLERIREFVNGARMFKVIHNVLRDAHDSSKKSSLPDEVHTFFWSIFTEIAGKIDSKKRLAVLLGERIHDRFVFFEPDDLQCFNQTIRAWNEVCDEEIPQIVQRVFDFAFENRLTNNNTTSEILSMIASAILGCVMDSIPNIV